MRLFANIRSAPRFFFIAILLLAPGITGLAIFVSLISGGKSWVWDIIGSSIGFGFVSTLVFVGLQKALLREKRYRTIERNLSVVTDVIMWALMSFVLMSVAFNFFNRAVYGDGIPILHASKAFGLSLSDMLAIGFFILLLIFRIAYPRTQHLPKEIGNLRDELDRIRARAWGWVVGITLASLTIWSFFCWLNDFTAGEHVCWLPPKRANVSDTPALLPNSLLSPMPVLFVVAALLLMIGTYLAWRRIWTWMREELLAGLRREDIAGADLLQVLFLSLVVLPPLVLGTTMHSAVDLSGRLPIGDQIVFGLFIYSGLMVWTVCMNLTDKMKMSWLLLTMLALFFYAALATILWAVLIDSIRRDALNIDTVLNVAIGATLIIIIFSFLYRRVLGKSLSDRWPGERPNFIIFSILLGVLLVTISNDAALPMAAYKFVAVVLGTIGLLIVPALLLKRRIAAYVLIRSAAGLTQDIQQMLEDDEVDAASLFGPYDLIARVEVEKRFGTEDALARLAEVVGQKIRAKPGILATHSHIDISHMVTYWYMSRRKK